MEKWSIKGLNEKLLTYLISDNSRKKKQSKHNAWDKSTTSTISSAEMRRVVNSLRNKRFRDSTRNNYHTIWKAFSKFYQRLDEKPDSWEDRIILYIGYLVDQKRQSQTIRSYVSAIRAVLRDDGIKLSEDSFLLSSLTRACKLHNDKIRTRFPIHKDLLHVVIRCIRETIYKNQPYLSSLYSALMSTAYYGLFRVGEVTTGTHPIQAKDVYLADNKKKMLFILHTSKTHNKGNKPQRVTISASGNGSKIQEYCPFEILQKYISMRPGRITKNESFFVFRDRTPVTPNQFRKILQKALKKAGIKSDFYCTHSFRIGRSTDLYKKGISVETICKLGRWSNTNSVYTYLR